VADDFYEYNSLYDRFILSIEILCIFTSRETESWYCFQRVCLSLCVCVSRNQKVALDTRLVVWTDRHISVSISACVFVPLSESAK